MGETPLRALTTGVAGQDGTYLAELLLAEGIEVHGTVRRSGDARPLPVPPGVHLHLADLASSTQVDAVVADVAPHEVYILALRWPRPGRTQRGRRT